jgi:hypothetical protein
VLAITWRNANENMQASYLRRFKPSSPRWLPPRVPEPAPDSGLIESVLWDMQCTDEALWDPDTIAKNRKHHEVHCWQWPDALTPGPSPGPGVASEDTNLAASKYERLLCALALLRGECDLLEQLIWRKPRGFFRVNVGLLARAVRNRLWPRWTIGVREAGQILLDRLPEGILMDGEENPLGDTPLKAGQELWLYVPLAQLWKELESVGHWQEQFKWVTIKWT